MCRSMTDIQSATAGNRRGKKKIEEDRKKKPQDKNIMAALFHRAAIKMTMRHPDAVRHCMTCVCVCVCV